MVAGLFVSQRSANRGMIMPGKNGSNGAKTAMTPVRAAVIQSYATKTFGPVQRGGFAAMAQAAATINVQREYRRGDGDRR